MPYSAWWWVTARGRRPAAGKWSGPDLGEAGPVERDAVTGPVGGHGEAPLDAQGLGDVAVEAEAVRLEVAAVGAGGEQVDRNVVRPVRGHRQPKGLGQMGDLHERGDAAEGGDV